MTHVINQGMAMYWGTSRWSSMEIMVGAQGTGRPQQSSPSDAADVDLIRQQLLGAKRVQMHLSLNYFSGWPLRTWLGGSAGGSGGAAGR